MNFRDFLVTIIMSFILIFLAHSIFDYFKNNFTQKKTYDFINKPNEKYESMYNTINSEKNEKNEIESIEKKTNNPENTNEMKDKLKNFLKSVQNNELESDTTPISEINNYTNI